jgi:phage gp46-like protein
MNGQSWLIDPATGDYDMDETGNPVLDTTLQTPIYVRLMGPRTRWLHAPDSEWGSDFWQIKNDKSLSSQPNVVAAAAQRAVQPIIDDGRAEEMDVSTLASGRGYRQIQIIAVDASGPQPPLILDPIS